MPSWLQWLLAAAAVVTAVATLWRLAIRPAARVIAKLEEMLPVLVELTEVFHEAPSALKVLAEIAAQFRSDSGQTLKDQINRLESAAKVTAVSAEVLSTRVEAVKQLAAGDRADVAQVAQTAAEARRLMQETLESLTGKVEELKRQLQRAQ